MGKTRDEGCENLNQPVMRQADCENGETPITG